ncbi:tyrosine-type recombinase/integrase [Limosilactobacillus mucosae]|uniref:tyrosine-type recombinase/integrase n=1 Tax=Limosilactobacillus mucosae TaxID=97478 RepID=UPI003A5215C8
MLFQWIVRQWQLKQRKALFALGYNAINGNQIVFQGRNNKYLSIATLNDTFKRIQTRNKLKVIPIHGLRHTHCSLLLAAGVPVNDVKDRLGHANIQTTLNIYAHVTKQQRKDTADKFIRFM